MRKIVLREEIETVPIAGLIEKINSERAGIKILKLERLNIKVNTGAEMLRFNGFMGVIRDSMIMISVVPAMGYEAARIIALKDSILIINRIDKYYIWDSNERIKEYYGIPLSVFELENILLNEFISRVKVEAIRARGMHSEIRDSMQYFACIMEQKNELYQFESMSSMQQGVIKLFRIKNISSGAYIRIEYDGFHKKGKENFYNKLYWKTNYRNRFLEGEMEIRSYSINEDIRARIRIPDNYSRKEI